MASLPHTANNRVYLVIASPFTVGSGLPYHTTPGSRPMLHTHRHGAMSRNHPRGLRQMDSDGKLDRVRSADRRWSAQGCFQLTSAGRVVSPDCRALRVVDGTVKWPRAMRTAGTQRPRLSAGRAFAGSIVD